MRNETNDLQKKDILAVYYYTLVRMRSSNPRINIDSVIREAYYSPAPRFYPSEQWLRRFVMALAEGREIHLTNKNKVAMYKEIARRYVQAGGNDPSIIPSIAMQPAPRFYLTFKTFRRIVYEQIKTKSW